MHRLRLRLGDERGIALVMAIGIVFVLSLSLSAIITFTGSNARSANYSKAGQTAHALAEAGLNNALSVLYATYPKDFYALGDLLPERTTTYQEGTAKWSGQYLLTQADHGVWKITSTGIVKNPTGPDAADVKRTLTIKVPAILPKTAPAVEIWNWIYVGKKSDDLSVCDMTIDQSVVVSAPLYVEGNLCLDGSATIVQPEVAARRNRLVVGGRFWLKKRVNSAGTATARLSEAHVVKGCGYWIQTVHDPCHGPRTGTLDPVVADADNVFVESGRFYTGLPDPPVTPPTVLWGQWYELSSPGPFHPCKIVSGTPPVFDLPTGGVMKLDDSLDSTPIPPNTSAQPQNLTPSRSYTCRTEGDKSGELSWDADRRILTVSGTIYVDGSVTVDMGWAGSGRTASYTGWGTMYVSGTFLIKNANLCAVVASDGSTCDADAWNPNTRALVIVAKGTGSLGGAQAQVGTDDGVEVKSASFQGFIYAANEINVGTTSSAQGPMMTPSTISPGQTSKLKFPLIEILPTGAPGVPLPPAQLGNPRDFDE